MKLISLGYPRSLISIERHLYPYRRPNRRYDILSFRVNGSDISPLLLIECKATKIDHRAFHQVMGYNFYISAPFVALTNGCSTILSRADGSFVMDNFLTFEDMCNLEFK